MKIIDNATLDLPAGMMLLELSEGNLTVCPINHCYLGIDDDGDAFTYRRQPKWDRVGFECHKKDEQAHYIGTVEMKYACQLFRLEGTETIKRIVDLNASKSG